MIFHVYVVPLNYYIIMKNFVEDMKMDGKSVQAVLTKKIEKQFFHIIKNCSIEKILILFHLLKVLEILYLKRLN